MSKQEHATARTISFDEHRNASASPEHAVRSVGQRLAGWVRESSVPSARRRLWPHTPWLVTWIHWFAVGVFVLASLGVAAKVASTGGTASHLTAGLCAVAGLAALAGRHRWPVLVLFSEVLLVVVTAAVAQDPSANFQILFLAVATYAYVSWTEGPRALVTVAVCWSVVLGAEIVGGTDSVQIGLSEAFLLGASTAIGLYVRSHRALLASLQDRAEQAEREQHWATARAVAQERVRIARELHDVVAHHVSLLVIQAGAVRESLPADHPTREVLDSMIAGGRTSMAELRHLLDALRAAEYVQDPAGAPAVPGGPTMGADRGGRQPQPGLEEIPELVARARFAGLPVELITLGQPTAVLPVTSLAAYRIVQEALTNVIKHAPGAPTAVEVTYYPDAMQLRVTNGAKPPADVLGPPPEVRQLSDSNHDGQVGLGVVGMRERAALCGGQLTAGPTLDGFEVSARLPTRPAGPA